MKSNYKPGQIASIHGNIYRVKKRAPENILSCTGCALNNLVSCPNIAFTNTENKTPLNCDVDGLIFVKI